MNKLKVRRENEEKTYKLSHRHKELFFLKEQNVIHAVIFFSQCIECQRSCGTSRKYKTCTCPFHWKRELDSLS